MKKSKKILFSISIIIAIVVVVILLLISLLQMRKKRQEKEFVSEIIENDGKGYTAQKSLSRVKDYNTYFSVKSILTDYILNFEQINGDVTFDKGRIQLSDEEIRQQRHESGIKAITQNFDEQYKNTQAYDEEKIENYVEKYKNTSGNSHYILYIEEMYKADIQRNCMLILVYSKVNGKDFNCMIKIDWENKKYSVFWDDYLEVNNYTKDRTEEIDINADIEKGDFNTFMPAYLNDQDIAIRYFDDLKYKLKNNTNELYYDLLDEEYKEKRFPSTDLFIDFITEIRARIDKMEVNKYKYEGDKISVVDNYENIYTFKISEVMEYKVLLDNYTIKNNELTGLYNKADEQEKVNSNIKEFFNMINMKDYNGIYNKLDNSFKSNNYPTLNDLKAFIQQNFYEYSVIEETTNAVKDNNNYIYTVSFLDGENKSAEAKEITIVMQLKENADYVMSFSMEEAHNDTN